MKNFFNLKLYFEGLKKIRLVGIIAGIITIVLNGLIPLFVLLNTISHISYAEEDAQLINISQFSILLPVIMFLTPLFFLSMFSFLNKRNESDFYHSIPYKRGCVLGSFLAAIYTWIFAIIVLAVLGAAFLWFINPSASFAFSTVPLLIIIYSIATFYIGGFILLSMMLSGTLVSNITVSMIAMFSFRFIGVMISSALSSLVPMFDLTYSVGKIFSFKYWLPTAILNGLFDESAFSNAFLWIFSIIVAIVFYVFAWICYCKRKSETAGRSAPARALQHLYRILFALPFALLTTLAILLDGEGFIVILALITLVVYFVYELVTVKNVKSTLRSAPLLLVLISFCVAFAVGCIGTAELVYAGRYEADDIKSIRKYDEGSIWDMFDPDYNSYEKIVTEYAQVPDEEARELVAEALANTIEYEQNESRYSYMTERLQNIEIVLNSGRKIGRKLYFSDENYAKLQEIIQSSDEYKAAYITLPERKSIQRISCSLAEDVSEDALMELWDTFVAEYEKLSDEEKSNYKTHNQDHVYSGHIEMRISLNGTIGISEYYANYYVPESFTETRALYSKLLEPKYKWFKNVLQDICNGDINSLSIDGAGELSWAEIYLDFYIQGSYYSNTFGWSNGEVNQEAYNLAKELYSVLLPYLTNTPSDGQYCSFYISYQGNTYKHKTVYFGVDDMSETDKIRLLSIIGGMIETDPKVLYEKLESFSDNQYDRYFKNYESIFFNLQFEYDGEFFEIDNGFLGEDWENPVNTSKELIGFMLPYFSFEGTEGSPVWFNLKHTNSYGTTYNCIGELYLNLPDDESKQKFYQLLEQLKKEFSE